MVDYLLYLFLLLIFAPYLIYKGYKYNDNMLIILGILLCCYECVWIYFSGPQVIYLKK